jgi:hypothetical protein
MKDHRNFFTWRSTTKKDNTWKTKEISISDSARHQSQDICPPFSQIVLKNFIKVSLIIKECLDEILIKLAIALKISKSSWNTVICYVYHHSSSSSTEISLVFHVLSFFVVDLQVKKFLWSFMNYPPLFFFICSFLLLKVLM